MPPSIVLEIMKVLEKEIQLRDETRGAERVKIANLMDGDAEQVAAQHKERSLQLSDAQLGLNERIEDVIEKILALPEAEANFGKELGLLSQVTDVMAEAADILARPETGPEAVAAETEVIELLLQTRRIQPKNGGGGGGSSPGGGGGGTTEQAALAMIGTGADEGAFIEERQIGQATGQAGREYPAEFGAGLDKYFNEIEKDR